MSAKNDTPKPELLPCPFCGADAAEYVFNYSHKSDHHRYVVCLCCGCQTSRRPTNEIAGENWNLRA